jgi:hypothetical protein
VKQAELISERECDFVEALAALHELVGSVVNLWVLGAKEGSRLATLTASGLVAGGAELGPGDSAPVALSIAGATLLVSPDTLAGAWRDEYERLVDGARWLVLYLRFRGGTEIELEQLLPDPS